MTDMNHTIKAHVALQLLRITDFEAYEGQCLTIRFGPGEAESAKLAQVVQLSGYSTLERKPFSILLQTSQLTTYYPQAIYPVEHPDLGVMDIFLVPVGFKDGGMQYEAVFS
ncbi:MAG TPA: hypothetical protein VFS22_07770 [Flavisolibacter sp.]|nr:hypothetical protein [Flavisolibacter sp.]